jgi:hypothetical protein
MQSTFSQAMDRSRRSSAAEKAMGNNWLVLLNHTPQAMLRLRNTGPAKQMSPRWRRSLKSSFGLKDDRR